MTAKMQQQKQRRTLVVAPHEMLFVAATIAIALAVAVGPASATSFGHSVSKRSYFDINCKGLYDMSSFARLDRICRDCYSLYREPELHTLCRSDCFSSPFFKACLKALLREHEEEEFSKMIDVMGR